MDNLTRSQHPDLRLFTQFPGKLAWFSNRSYKTRKGCEALLAKVNRSDARRGVTYKIVVDGNGEYRILAKGVTK